MKKSEQLNYIKCLFSSSYCVFRDGGYEYSPKLVNFLKKNPQLESTTMQIFSLRDEMMQPENYDERWDMGYFLMNEFNIEFAQSEGSELIFSLCCAIKSTFTLSDRQIGEYLVKSIKEIP